MVINSKAWLPFLLLVSSLFLAFSLSFTLAEQDTDQQCQQECKDFQSLPIQSTCLSRCKNMGPWSGPPVAGEMVWYSQSHGQECRQECEKQGTRVPLEHCQRKCMQQRKFKQCHEQCQQTIQSPEICQKICGQHIEGGQGEELQSYVSNHHELQQCQQRCQSQRGQKQHQCLQECQDQMRQHGHQQCQQRCQSQRGQKQHQCLQECQDQMRQQGQQGQDQMRQQGQQYGQHQCQQRCQSQGGQKQHQCLQKCQDQTGQHGQQGQQGQQEQEREQMKIICQQHCEMQQGSGGGQQCQRQCEQQVEQLEKQFEQCHQRCQSQEHGQQQQCLSTCIQEIKDQQRRQQQGQGKGQGSGDNGVEYEDQNGKSRQRYDQCMESCSRQQQGQGEQEQCPRQCREQFEQEKGQYQQCKQGCERSSQHDDERRQCKEKCKQLREQQHQRGGGGCNEVEDDEALNGSGYGGAKERYEQCKRSCKSQLQGQGQQEQCPKQCKQQFEQEKQQFKQCKKGCEKQAQDDDQKKQCKLQCAQQGQQQRGGSTGGVHPNQGEEEQMMGDQRNNPFYFPSQMFQSRFQSDEGSLQVLVRFGKSELLRGIKNYRLAIFEAMPNTFVLPHHCDAEAIFVVLNGQCTCTLLLKDRKESFNMEHGDVIRVRAGTTIYLTNNNNDEPLHIAKLIRSVNSPGRFEEFFPAGSGNPESYFSVFSNDILESAFSTPRKELEQGFRQQRGQQGGQGIVMRAPKEQLEALSQRASSARREGRRQSEGPFNLRQLKPVHSNNYGQLFEARPEEFSQFQDMDVSVSCIEMNQQTMMVPHFNSKATFLIYVVEGNVRVEMVCPHLASQMQGQETTEQQEQGEHSGRFMKVNAQLSPGDAFVIPAGHPVAFVTHSNNGNQNQNIRILGFGLNAQYSMRNFLAGQKDNIMLQMNREAKQLAFGQDMEKIFGKQQESYFVPAHKGRRGKSHPMSSILEFAGII
ncbi:vicilin Jug r 2.0101-like isoform X1 [Malus sylvestris]|uniref:vicilin Jug r 2.0101-like isoform X1 n=1 Tax=Malus sylvestris TaxID=3752 RepID=UPI0021AC1014|nr:vicilin Jug r 2.0101-like isoform X1 [Malus sylvestris]